MQRAVLSHRIIIKNVTNRIDTATLNGFVDGNLFVCPEYNISVPLTNVLYIENLSKVELQTPVHDPIQNLKPAVKTLKAPTKDE